MQKSCKVFRAGTRRSRLAVVQSRGALAKLTALDPTLSFDEVLCSSPGDRDASTDLRDSPPDFFTRDLDDAIHAGTLDLAIHSAKDLPDPVADGLDWFWLPWREDARDVLVLPKGVPRNALPASPRIGISSERRADYCHQHFPNCQTIPIRGTIEARLAQLDAGSVDVVIMAGAALIRLGLEDRITEWIPLAELPAPEGQGVLALTFREGDPFFQRLRCLFVKSVTFVGAGVGSADMCTIAGLKALQRCDVCLYDTLMDPALLDVVPPGARCIDVGKRCGQHVMKQPEITALIATMARRGYRVVRLKGGDSGLFGRLAEEIELLEKLHLPYRVIPGVSSLSIASTGTGMLLTRRGISRGFCVMTPRQQGGGVGSIQAHERAQLPIVFFMAVNLIPDIARQLIAEGRSPDCLAALVFNAGSENEHVLRATLATLPDILREQNGTPDDTGGLFIVGEVTRFSYNRSHGALEGRRILLACDKALRDEATYAVHDLGGSPLHLTSGRETLPTFDTVFFATGDDVEAFLTQWGRDSLREQIIVAMDVPTAAVLEHHGLTVNLLSPAAAVTASIAAMACMFVRNRNVETLPSMQPA